MKPFGTTLLRSLFILPALLTIDILLQAMDISNISLGIYA